MFVDLRGGFCYVVMCHTDPVAVERLVGRIKTLSPSAHVIVRHDIPGLLDPARIEALGGREFVSDVDITWGDWSGAVAAVELIEHARTTTDASHFVIVSGQDYPVRNLVEWERQVVACGADALVDVYPRRPEDWKYRWYAVRPPAVRPTVLRRGLKFLWRRIGRAFMPIVIFYGGRRDPRWMLGLRRLSLLAGKPPVPVTKGSAWMTLSRAAVDRVVDRHRHDHAAREFFRRVRIPDESYLHSLLDADETLRLIDCPTSYARFRYDEWSPVWLDTQELLRVAATPCAFARKVAEDVDPAVLVEADRLAARAVTDVVPVHHAVQGEPRLTGAELTPPRVR
jgi:hypothetical protein